MSNYIGSLEETMDIAIAIGIRNREIVQLRAENDQLREALFNLLKRDHRNTCQHQETHRGGTLWEICDQCGAKWADDNGGKPEWTDPPEWDAAEAALRLKLKRLTS